MGSNASKGTVGPFEEFNMNEIQAIEDENELLRAKQVILTFFNPCGESDQLVGHLNFAKNC